MREDESLREFWERMRASDGVTKRVIEARSEKERMI